MLPAPTIRSRTPIAGPRGRLVVDGIILIDDSGALVFVPYA
jgi:hypothetical protein